MIAARETDDRDRVRTATVLDTFAMSGAGAQSEADAVADGGGGTKRAESSVGSGGGGHALLPLSAPEESGALAGKKDRLLLRGQQRAEEENNENSSCDGEGEGEGGRKGGEGDETVDGQTSNDDDTAAEDSGLGEVTVAAKSDDSAAESSDGGERELVAQRFIASPTCVYPAQSTYPPRVAYIISTSEGNGRGNNTTVTRINGPNVHYVSNMTSETVGTVLEEVEEEESGGNAVDGVAEGEEVPESAAAQMRRSRQQQQQQQQGRQLAPPQEQTRLQHHLLQQQQLSRISKDIRRRERRERRVRRQLLQRHRAIYGAGAEHVGPAHHFSFSAADAAAAGYFGGGEGGLVMPPPPYSTLPTPGRRGGQQSRGSRLAQENARNVRHLIPAGVTMDIAR